MNIKWYNKLNRGGFKHKELCYFSNHGIYIPVDIVQSYNLEDFKCVNIGMTKDDRVAIRCTTKAIKNTLSYCLTSKVSQTGKVAKFIGCELFIKENKLIGSRLHVEQSFNEGDNIVLVLEHA